MEKTVKSNSSSKPIPTSTSSSDGFSRPRLFSGSGASLDPKTMYFDENMKSFIDPQVPHHHVGSPFSNLLSSSPTASGGGSPKRMEGRRDSLKNMWHLQDFATE